MSNVIPFPKYRGLQIQVSRGSDAIGAAAFLVEVIDAAGGVAADVEADTFDEAMGIAQVFLDDLPGSCLRMLCERRQA